MGVIQEVLVISLTYDEVCTTEMIVRYTVWMIVTWTIIMLMSKNKLQVCELIT